MFGFEAAQSFDASISGDQGKCYGATYSQSDDIPIQLMAYIF
jgi:hypothetical protein